MLKRMLDKIKESAKDVKDVLKDDLELPDKREFDVELTIASGDKYYYKYKGRYEHQATAYFSGNKISLSKVNFPVKDSSGNEVWISYGDVLSIKVLK